MARKCLLLSALAVLPSAFAQVEQCVSLATSTTCAAFNGSSISTDESMIGLYPFLQGVSDGASFDRNLTAYVQKGYVSLKYQTLFGCSDISLDNTTNLYARFTTTVLCNGVIQNSISRCGLTATNSQPVCADTCAEYALSEQMIVANADLCLNPSNYTDTQLRADYTNCGLPQNALTDSTCIEGITNEPTNCGFGYATIGLCQYCAADGENPTDPCCSRAQASTRCANVALPSISVTSTAFLTATGSSSQVSNSPTTSSSSSSVGDVGTASKHEGGLSGGTIAGIVVGSVAGLALLLVLAILLICCCRRRRNHSPTESVSQHREKIPVTPALAYSPNDSEVSSLGRAPSEYEVLPEGGPTHKTALPSEYSFPPFTVVLPSSKSEYGGDLASSSQRPKSFSSKKKSNDFPRGFYANPKRSASIADSDYVVLPGGRRVKTATSIASNSRRGSLTLDEHGIAPGPNTTTRKTDRKNLFSKMDTPPARPSIGGSSSNMDDYEILPGGRIARKSGLTGHVGGVAALTDLRGNGEGIREASAAVSTSTTQPPSVITDRHTSDFEAAPTSTTKGPTMPSISSVKDYYSSSDIQPGDKVTAVWSYAARTHDEFALERGDVLRVKSIWGDGWAIGYLSKQDIDVSTEQNGADTTSAQDGVTADVGAGDKDIKAFPLVCVCASEYWDRVIEAGGKPLASTTDIV